MERENLAGTENNTQHTKKPTSLGRSWVYYRRLHGNLDTLSDHQGPGLQGPSRPNCTDDLRFKSLHLR